MLLHGFGARGDDLVPLARRLLRARTRFLIPAAPLEQGTNGRAWWRLDLTRPLRVWDGKVPADYRANPEVLDARAAVQALLARIREQFAPERLVLARFSQGGMLTLDVALAGAPSVDRAAILSGVLLAESIESLRRFREKSTRFFIAHGRNDAVLPFAGAEGTYDELMRAGVPATMLAFDGGHEIPDRVVNALAEFLFAS